MVAIVWRSGGGDGGDGGGGGGDCGSEGETKGSDDTMPAGIKEGGIAVVG